MAEKMTADSAYPTWLVYEFLCAENTSTSLVVVPDSWCNPETL